MKTLNFKGKSVWSDEHNRIMLELWPCTKEIAKRVGRNEKAVCERARLRGLRKGTQSQKYNWTEEKEEELRKYYPVLGRKQTAMKIGVPEVSVKRRAKTLGRI